MVLNNLAAISDLFRLSEWDYFIEYCRRLRSYRLEREDAAVLEAELRLRQGRGLAYS